MKGAPLLFRLLFNIFTISISISISLSHAATTCNSSTDYQLLLRALSSVSGSFTSSSSVYCSSSTVRHINLSHQNLRGTISWRFLRNLSHLQTVDFSNNSLTGTVPAWFWAIPTLLQVDLSNNQFGGTVGFHDDPISGHLDSSSSSNIRILTISNNRFTNLVTLSAFTKLKFLDVSHNDVRHLPSGLGNLAKLQHLDVSSCNLSGTLKPISGLGSLTYLDVSNNKLQGNFPSDFPPLASVQFLNISVNNFTGQGGGPDSDTYSQKFGNSAFIHAWDFNVPSTTTTSSTSKTSSQSPPRTPPPHYYPYKFPRGERMPSSTRRKHEAASRKQRRSKNRSAFVIAVSTFGSAIGLTVMAVCVCCCCCVCRRRKKSPKRWAISKPLNETQTPFKMEKSGPLSFETGSGSSWAVADIKEASAAPVVMFEKPLMNLTFRDLIAATSHFGKESQLGEGRHGPVYRAVLPGEIHVAIKVLESAREVQREDAIAMFEDASRLRHPNLLPLSGYCIAGNEKLVLYEFLANGDLQSWLDELPAGRLNVDDWSTDTWDYDQHNDILGGKAASPDEKLNWKTCHRIALGIARGLAYLHHGRSRAVVHGHLVPSNILLADHLEPRIADFGLWSWIDQGSDHSDQVTTCKDDVYSYGMILIQLLTRKPGTKETVAWVRGLVKDGHGAQALDPRLTMTMAMGGEYSYSVREMVDCLRAGYLCTSEIPDKRPTMQQVVGLLKDIYCASSASLA
ncbi:hypothetical protein Dimus_032650 [Dionaea muscipula]